MTIWYITNLFLYVIMCVKYEQGATSVLRMTKYAQGYITVSVSSGRGWIVMYYENNQDMNNAGKVVGKRRANRWTQIGVGLIAIVLGIIMSMSITASMYVSSILKEAGLSTAISHRLMDTVFDSLGDNIDALADIQTSIENSQIIDKIAQKYTTAMVNGMLEEKDYADIEVNIDSELDELMDMAYNGILSNINMGDIQKKIVRAALTYSETAAKQAINNYASGIYGDISYRLQPLIKVYGIITSSMFKILMLFIYITLLIVIIVFNPVRVVRYTLPCIFVITGGIYIFIANIIGNRCMAAVSNRYLGRTVFIDTQIAYRVMGVMCILAAASYVITLIYGMVVKNRRKRI